MPCQSLSDRFVQGFSWCCLQSPGCVSAAGADGLCPSLSKLLTLKLFKIVCFGQLSSCLFCSFLGSLAGDDTWVMDTAKSRQGDALAPSACPPSAAFAVTAGSQLFCSCLTQPRICSALGDGIYLPARMWWPAQQLVSRLGQFKWHLLPQCPTSG